MQTPAHHLQHGNTTAHATKTPSLLIGHGSREPEGNDEIHRFSGPSGAHAARLEHRGVLHRVCAPSLPDGLLHAARNARWVLVLPLILECGRPREDGDS